MGRRALRVCLGLEWVAVKKRTIQVTLLGKLSQFLHIPTMVVWSTLNS